MMVQDRTAVVTGSNRGIGKAIVEKLALEGANVFACARSASEEFERDLQTLQDRTGRVVTPLYFDMDDPQAMKAAVKTIHATKIPIDILVNNAGIAGDTLFQMTTIHQAKHVMDVNFFAPLLFTQYVTKLMKKSVAPSIINISSMAATNNYAGMFSYSASKAALESMTKTLAKELGDMNIRVNAIAPGVIQTDLLNQFIPDEAYLQKMIGNSCMKRLGTPEDVANGVLYLASSLSSFVTGQVIRIDGGIY